jgi:micrococcal nuclease
MTDDELVGGVSYLVSLVIDGDTIDVEKDGARVRVRLIGVDTPETVDPRRLVQCFGKEASDKARELLEGKLVRLENDPSQGLYDKYDRMLAYVYLPDGTLFNSVMISEGYAHEYTYRLPYRYQKEFKAAERVAREKKMGLWADGVCAE